MTWMTQISFNGHEKGIPPAFFGTIGVRFEHSRLSKSFYYSPYCSLVLSLDKKLFHWGLVSSPVTSYNIPSMQNESYSTVLIIDILCYQQ